MIKKLRRKFVAVTMGASLVLLAGVFLALALFTQRGMRVQSELGIEMALNQAEGLPGPGGGPAGKERGPGLVSLWEQPLGRASCVVLLVRRDGAVGIESGRLFLQEEFGWEELEELARSTAQQGQGKGVLSQYRLRYEVRETPRGALVALGDASGEWTAMAELAKSSLLAGGAALALLFGASVCLARWAVGPVEEAWRRQKQFVGDASHELKTPLTVILSNADMILTHPEGDVGRWAESIRDEGTRMKELTQELLTLAKAGKEEESGGKSFLPVDFSDLTAGRALSFEPAAYEAGVELESRRVAQGIRVLGDPPALERLVGILLDNGIRYCAPGGRVELSLEEAGRWARLTVENPGEEIPREELGRIFERFYRRDPARGRGGFGLGLAIAREIANGHRGRIWAESENGKNRFIVEIPLAGRGPLTRSA